MPTEPIVDTHIHLWHYVADRYPWLAEAGLEALRTDQLPDAYAARAKAAGIVASVHVEAGCLPEEGLDETRWFVREPPPPGVADRLVAHVRLGTGDAVRLLETQAAYDRVVGIRDIVSWHPDPEKSRLLTDRMNEPDWRRDYARLRDHRLSFDLLMTPWQVESACRLAADHPDTVIAVNHCGSPLDRDQEGMERWRRGLRDLARQPNIVMKISDPVVYDRAWTPGGLRDLIRTCIDAFGPDRAMFGSDHPLSGLFIDFDRWVAIFREAVADLTPGERAAVLSGTAARVYRLPEVASAP